ncbi:MAG: hypothetical protein OXG51_10625 [Gammaproteobacteria bacterium]|nr:hypothetical protein [Gammaproteobacteria bacterium]
MALGCLLMLLPLLGLCTFGALGGNHRPVAGDALKARECYVLRAQQTQLWRHRTIKRLGLWTVPRGNVFCVREIDRSGGQLWYRGRIMALGTLDRRRHIPGWIDSRQLMEHGAFLSY